MVLLDSSALLAVIYEELGAARVEDQLEGAGILAVNLEEAVRVLVRDGIPVPAVRRMFDELDLDVIDFTSEMAWRSAEQSARVTSGLGVADRACLAAAAVLGVEVLTADRGWSEAAAAYGVQVTLIR